jgi:hypothetical protein
MRCVFALLTIAEAIALLRSAALTIVLVIPPE